MSGFEPPPPPPSACSIRGNDDIVAVVSSAESGGVSLARLGGVADWEMIALSGDNESGRAKVRWSSGSPGLSIEGWVDAKELAFRAKQDVPIAQGHLFINAAAELMVDVVGANAHIRPYGTTFANIAATVSCSDLRIGHGDVEPVIGAPAYWTSAQKTLSLYAAPKGALVTTLGFSGASQFDTTPYAAMEEKNGFLHLVHYDGVHLDAWVKTSEMKPWLGEQPQFPFVCGMGSLELYDKNKIVRSLGEDTDVFLEPSVASTRVGTIARGARVHVVATKKSFVAIGDEHGGWGGAPDKKLWIRASTLGP
jgi:hypothetical protein